MSVKSKLKGLLLESGLSEIETAVYLELFKGPAVSSWELVGRTGMSKTSVYRALDRLRALKMLTEDNDGIRAASLKALVADLRAKERKTGKLADSIKSIAPFLSAPKDSIEEIEHLYTQEQIADAYLSMAQGKYDTNLDFGDFENFVQIFGGIDIPHKFRDYRVKHAGHQAICTTFGPNTAVFCTRDSEKKFKNKVNCMNIDYKNQFIIFSDTGDYVLFNEFSDNDNPSSVLIKSRAVADAQRMQFDIFSHRSGK